VQQVCVLGGGARHLVMFVFQLGFLSNTVVRCRVQLYRCAAGGLCSSPETCGRGLGVQQVGRCWISRLFA
jgi:hypothetical protein